MSVLKPGTLSARFVGTRIGEPGRGAREGVDTPRVERIGTEGIALIYRFGVVVTYALSEPEIAGLHERLADAITGRFESPERDDLIVESGASSPGVDADGVLGFEEITLERLVVAATVLAKSVVLAHYEVQIAPVLERAESFADRMRSGGHRIRSGSLLAEIGSVLLTQARMVGRVGVAEKPELVWDDLSLDRIYERLAREYELLERDAVISRKLDLIESTMATYLNLIHNRRALRVEWYIVWLIVFEIALSFYEMFWHPVGS